MTDTESNTNAQNQPAPTSQHVSTEVPIPVVESASASTACQTNTSKFAYIVTGSVLGVIVLALFALAMMVYVVFGAWYAGNSSARDWSYYEAPHRNWYDDYHGYLDGDDFSW